MYFQYLYFKISENLRNVSSVFLRIYLHKISRPAVHHSAVYIVSTYSEKNQVFYKMNLNISEVFLQR